MPVAPLWKVFVVLLAVKLAYFTLLLVALQIGNGDFEEVIAHSIRQGWFETADPRWQGKYQDASTRHFATWDALHYLFLSEQGYARGIRSCAFYPLWPLFIRCFSLLTGGNHLIAALLLANSLSLAAWTLFYRVTAERFGGETAECALVLFVAFPGSVFYQFVYTEPLFLLLLALLWFGLERQRYGVACGAAFLLPLTRAIGVFSLLPIAWHCFSLVRNGGRGRGVQTVSRKLLMALLLAPLFGLAIYFALMWHWTGNPLEGMQAQKYWKAHSISNLWNVPKFVVGLFQVTDWHSFHGSMLDRAAFVLLLYSFPSIWRLGTDLMLWTLVLGVLPAMSGMFVSFTRFESAVFPLFIVLGIVFTERTKPWSRLGRIAVLVVMSLLHLLLLWRFLNYRWAG